MNTDTLTLDHSMQGIEWSAFYAEIEKKGNVPNASYAIIDANKAVFRGMYFNLADIKASISDAKVSPALVTIYADVLFIPANIIWVLNTQGLIIYARRIEVEDAASITLDYQKNTNSKLILFGSEMSGILIAKAVFTATSQPQLFEITQKNIAPGLAITATDKIASIVLISLKNGFAMEMLPEMELYLNNAFIFGSLLYDQEPHLAVSLFLWVKGWSAQNNDLQELFYRSSNLATLLNSELNAKVNGASFVPYLTSTIYTKLSGEFAKGAAKYESDYKTLSVQQVLTEENINMAKTMVINTQSEISYISALLAQANENYNNAETAAKNALKNFNNQQLAVQMVAIDFEEIGIPEYQRKVILDGIFDLVTSIVTFGGAIALMAVGDEAAAPAAAKGAVNAVEAVADAASSTAKVVKLADELAKTMENLKKLVEVLQKVYELAMAIKAVADNISSAQSKTDIIQQMQDTTDGADLSAADGWTIFQIKADNAMQDPIDLGIQYAQDYKEAMNILVVYGQSLSAAQLAVIKASQDAAALSFQLQYAKQKEANLQKLVDQLKVGEKTTLDLMQQLYLKYLNSKSALFSALKSYQDSFFYWALAESTIQPKIIDPVDDLNSGIQDIIRIAMDEASALERFNPPPQKMTNMTFAITDQSTLKNLQDNYETQWILKINNEEFGGLDRVRLDNIRVWLEGVVFTGGSQTVMMTITNTGNYLDRYNDLNYQFNSKGLTRTFKYKVSSDSRKADWSFENGTYGLVQIDGSVDHEVAYAYFRPTPFSEWKISLKSDNNGADFSAVTKITMYFEGSAIGSTEHAQLMLTKKLEDVSIS